MQKKKKYKRKYNSEKQIERLMIARYGITGQDFKKRLIKQGYKCAICRKKPDKKLFIDHCHKTKEVRGLLCHHCNSGLGMFKDSIKFINNAIKYLTKHAQKEKRNQKRKGNKK